MCGCRHGPRLRSGITEAYTVLRGTVGDIFAPSHQFRQRSRKWQIARLMRPAIPSPTGDGRNDAAAKLDSISGVLIFVGLLRAGTGACDPSSASGPYLPASQETLSMESLAHIEIEGITLALTPCDRRQSPPDRRVAVGVGEWQPWALRMRSNEP